MSGPTTLNFRLLARLPRSGGTWQLGRCATEMPLETGGRGVALLCVQGDSVARAVVLAEGEPTTADWAQLVHDAMRSSVPPCKPGLPAVLRIRDDSAAAALGKLVAPLKIRVESRGDFSSLDKAANRLGESLATAGTVELPDFDRALFAAAAAFARARPWTLITGEPEFALKTKITGWSDPVAVILGQAGETFGLAVYREDRFVPRSWAEDGGSHALDTVDSVVVLLDDDPEQGTLKRALRHGYELEPDWMPTFLRTIPGRGPALLGAPDHARLLTLAMRAVVAWIERFHESGDLVSSLAMFNDQVVCRLANVDTFRATAREQGDDDVHERRDLDDTTPLFEADEPLPPIPKTTDLATRARAWHALDTLMMDRALQTAPEPFLRSMDSTVQMISDGNDEHRGWPLPWFVHHVRVDAVGARLSEWIAVRCDDANVHTWLDANAVALTSIWQVRRIEADVGVELADALGKLRFFVYDRGLSRSLPPNALVFARIVNVDGLHVVVGCHPVPLPPMVLASLIEGLKAARKHAGVAKLAAVEASPFSGERFALLAHAWMGAVDIVTTQQPNPILQNTDGDPLLMTIDRFALTSGREDEVRSALLDLQGAEDDDEDGVVFARHAKAGKRKAGELDDTIIGRARFEGTKLTLETNSAKRADALRKRVESKCGGALRFLARTHQDPMSSALDGMKSVQPQPEPSPEMLDAMRSFRLNHMQRWLDEEIPALQGKTPRQAVKDRKLRPRLVALIEEIEYSEARLPVEQRIDLGFLRKKLGL